MRPGQALAAAVILLSIAGCGGGGPRFATWASRGERLPRAAPWPVEELPPADAVPWSGTVSHHLLADELIDRWFAELARRRSVGVFYILSPSHWGLSTQRYSLTDGSWQVPGGEVGSDRRRVAGLARDLGVALEPAVFEDEHGVSTLMPYLARHFPRARVVVVACRGEPPLDQPAALVLARALAPAFDRAGRRTNFLLVSADFAHHDDREGTAVKDERSRRFFDAPSPDTWIFAGCDNRPAIYVLAYLAGPATVSSVLYHADSLGLSGLGRDDITTYFFTYFWDRQQ